MAFRELLGNDRLKYRIAGMQKNGKISHCYVISGPEGSGKHTFAKEFCALLQCREANAPCLRCPQCRKVLEGVHPDIIHIDDGERKELSVAQVKAFVNDVYLYPNEGNRKIYIFDHAEKLNVKNQNTILKVLEEPPAYAAFLLMIPNSTLLLPTIRSRSVELAMAPLSPATIENELHLRKPGHTAEEYSAAAACGYLGKAMDLLENPVGDELLDQFVAAYAMRDALGLLRLFTSMEKMPRDQLRQRLESWRTRLVDTLCVRYSAGNANAMQQLLIEHRSTTEISNAVDILSAARDACDVNVGSPAICGMLAVRMAQ